jgi:Zn-dependent peptidase ImmA (M78 family)/transcriptional regulator with XRE-family HTH domain
MFAARLREIRLAKGYTLDELAGRMEGEVTKQAISKYETGSAHPRPKTLVALAKALDVKSAELFGEPDYAITCLQYRTRAPLRSRSKERVEAVLRYSLERRLRLEDRLAAGRRPRLPKKRITVDTVEQAEGLAGTIRNDWRLGCEPIANFTEVLERQSIHVFEVPGDDDFDGLAAVARTEDGELRGVGIAENPERDGDRQRFNLAHEVGHVVMEPVAGLNEEDAASRFAGALLVPASLVFEQLGERRSDVSLDELLLLKKSWGVSAQCILHRLRDLDVISQNHYEWWWREIDALGYRTTEPMRLEREQSTWERRNVARARAERLISSDEAAAYLGEVPPPGSSDGIDRRFLMKLSANDRHAVLREQAERLAADYEQSQVSEWLGADLNEPKRSR